MTFAWYGHLKHFRESPLWIAILVSWGIAFFEYTLMVPANRMGFGRYTLPQLKVIQEIITLTVFAIFSAWYMKDKLTLNHLWAGCCLVGAAFFQEIGRSFPATGIFHSWANLSLSGALFP